MHRQAGKQRGVLTLQASQFAHILEEGPSPTDLAYKDDLLSRLTDQQKARVLQRASLHAMTTMLPDSKFTQAPAGLRVDGRRRGQHQSEHDYCHGGRHVECKGTTMRWDSYAQRWVARWHHIKFQQLSGPIDDLVLALHSPGQVDVVLHDHIIGVARDGMRTCILGNQVVVYADRAFVSSSEARGNILHKMSEVPGACQKVATLETHGSLLLELICAESDSSSAQHSSSCYKDVPLFARTATSRALRLQRLAFEVDQILHPECNFLYGVGAADLVGVGRVQRRGPARASADWSRNEVRVEFKTSKLIWHSAGRYWHLQFSGVKFGEVPAGTRNFDELWLGVYSPHGLSIWQHFGSFGLSTHGVRTSTVGHTIAVVGPRGEPDIATALQAICTKLRRSGCKLLATVAW